MDALFNAVDLSGIWSDSLSGIALGLTLFAIVFVFRLVYGLIFPQFTGGGSNDD